MIAEKQTNIYISTSSKRLLEELERSTGLISNDCRNLTISKEVRMIHLFDVFIDKMDLSL